MVFSALTFGQEAELIWRQRWSLMTVLYLSVRFAGIGYAVMNILINVPTISMTDTGWVIFSNKSLIQHNDSYSCLIIINGVYWMGDVVNVILGVIMIARLHAMYQRSRKVLIFLVVIFLAIRIANVVMQAVVTMQTSGEEYVLSGTYQCIFAYGGDSVFLSAMTWILLTVWEVLALCIAVWIAVKHFRELRQHSTRGIIGDSFTVLMKTHVRYFAT
ncbi:hypothetical protein F4604DRAFT_1213919 [Suillus subluteus]|nr:hypothetical protein F4604DRAFT_1213919 [Suillus subluteus]